MASNSLVLTFEQIDDNVTVAINGDEVYSHNILRHNHPPAVVDLTQYLQNGRNELRLHAYNGPGSATLVGNLEFRNQQMSTWNVRAQSTGHGPFVEETIALMFHE